MTNVSDELAERLPGLGRLWSITKGHPSVRIAILDGSVDLAAVAGLQGEGPAASSTGRWFIRLSRARATRLFRASLPIVPCSPFRSSRRDRESRSARRAI